MTPDLVTCFEMVWKHLLATTDAAMATMSCLSQSMLSIFSSCDLVVDTVVLTQSLGGYGMESSDASHFDAVTMKL